MGALGTSVRIDLDKYLKALEVHVGAEKVGVLRKELEDYGVKGVVTVYTGPKLGDGEVVIPYTLEGTKGFLRFNANGKVYDGLKSKEVIATIASDTVSDFIGGLFGAKEVTPADSAQAAAQRQLQGAVKTWQREAAEARRRQEAEDADEAARRADEEARRREEADRKAQKWENYSTPAERRMGR